VVVDESRGDTEVGLVTSNATVPANGGFLLVKPAGITVA
jgi:hypothetical protein